MSWGYWVLAVLFIEFEPNYRNIDVVTGDHAGASDATTRALLAPWQGILAGASDVDPSLVDAIALGLETHFAALA